MLSQPSILSGSYVKYTLNSPKYGKNMFWEDFNIIINVYVMYVRRSLIGIFTERVEPSLDLKQPLDWNFIDVSVEITTWNAIRRIVHFITQTEPYWFYLQ